MWPRRVVVVEPVWQGGGAGGARPHFAAGSPALKVFETIQYDFAQATKVVFLSTATVTEAAGDFERALELHRAAATRWHAFGHQLEHAHALLGTARSLLALGQTANHELAQACTIFVRLAAAPHIVTVDEALADNTFATGS